MTKFFIDTGFYFCMYAAFFWLGYTIGKHDGQLKMCNKVLKAFERVSKLKDKPD